MDLKDYGSTSKYVVVDEGEYEVVVSATIQQTKDGSKDYLNLGLKIRDDVEQKYNDGHTFIWTKLFRDKGNPSWFNLAQSGNIIATQEGLPTYKSQFNEVEEFVQYINGISLRVKVNKAYDDVMGEERNNIDNASWKNPYSKTQAGVYVPEPIVIDRRNEEEKVVAQAPANDDIPW